MSRQPKFVLVLMLFATASLMAAYKPDARRGHPGDYDPGPFPNSKLAKLFGQTPNYRAIGQFVLGGGREKFRWMMGPMWYRGRLGRSMVKALILGQEGAQDENISNRGFTGSTGTKSQKFLNHLGLTASYFISNTFFYTINGQLDHNNKRFKWLEQGAEEDAESPLVKSRHEVYDEVACENADTLQLIMGVGSGGKASVATWINSHGGRCSPSSNLKNCGADRDGSRGFDDLRALRESLSEKCGKPFNLPMVVVGVPHPGGASPSNGGLGALRNIIRGFTDAARRVNDRIKNDEAFADAWFNNEKLPLDEVKVARNKSRAITKIKSRLAEEYKYGNAPIPFRDFAFGTNWRMGDRGTTSNRRGADSIQVFSADGRYNGRANISRPKDNVFGLPLAQGWNIPAMKHFVHGMIKNVDIPWESQRYTRQNEKHVSSYDYGPCEKYTHSCALSRALHTWPDFDSLGSGIPKPTNHHSFGYGPIHRGRFKNADVVILADQQSHDDFFSGRALTGEAGQRLQRILKIAGAGARYLILRTLPVDTIDLSTAQAAKIALHTAVKKSRERIFKYVDLARAHTLTLGPVAKLVADDPAMADFRDRQIGHLPSPNKNSRHYTAWDKVAGDLADALGNEKDGDYKKRRNGDADLLAISRIDLPSHTRWWMGSTGNRANSDGSGNYYRFWAPGWVKASKPPLLTETEKRDINRRLAAAGVEGRSDEDAKTAEPHEYWGEKYGAPDIAINIVVEGNRRVEKVVPLTLRGHDQDHGEFLTDAEADDPGSQLQTAVGTTGPVENEVLDDAATEAKYATLVEAASAQLASYGLAEEDLESLEGRAGAGTLFKPVQEPVPESEEPEAEEVGPNQ